MNIFISGITGTLGQAVMQNLLTNTNAHIFGYSRDEKKQSEIPSHPRLTLILGDVRDQRRVTESTRNCDLIFHFAALKRVDSAETNPEEFIETNVYGTMNILGAQRTNKVPRVVLSSTDKACLPINVYGFTKALSEKLVLRNQNNVVVRYGNVLASRGSAVIDFIKSIQEKGQVNITHPEMTRFFLKIEDAADFVIKSGFTKTGGLHIYEGMKSCYIQDLASAIGEMIGKRPAFNIIGMRPGEKIHEDLSHNYESGPTSSSFTADKFTPKELRDFLSPIVKKYAGTIRTKKLRIPELTL